VFEFHLDHIVETSGPFELMRTRWVDLDQDPAQSEPMLKVKDVCRYVRSKNAGPFWVTIDFFFDGPQSYAQFHDSEVFSATAIAAIYGVDPKNVRRSGWRS
jgi:Domain of unknown function (DUF4387)